MKISVKGEHERHWQAPEAGGARAGTEREAVRYERERK